MEVVKKKFPHVEWKPLRAFLEGDSDSGVQICITYTLHRCHEMMGYYPHKSDEEQREAFSRYNYAEQAENYYDTFQDASTIPVVREYLRSVWVKPF